MNIDYAAPLKKAFAFCIEPKRWLPFFIVDMAFLSVGLILILSNSLLLLYIVAGIQDMALFGNAAVMFFQLLGLFIVWMLIGIWINGALIHQSYKEKEFGRSWTVSRKRYLSLLGVTLIIALIAMLAAIIPVMGWIVSIFVGLVFFFAMQGVIIKGHGFAKALEDSWHIFKQQPFKVFLMWIVISVVTIIILAIFALPILALMARVVLDIVGTGGDANTATLMSIVYMLENQLPMIAVSGIIFILGMAIARVFSLKAQTEFYLQVRKSK